ncbi:MAG: thermonuclease family protein [Microgenomates group bacterium]
MDKKGLILYIVFVVLLFGAGLYLVKSDRTKLSFPNVIPSQQTPTPMQMIASRSAEFAVVKRVVDGDTIELVDGRKVRYIGVDTPELHHPTKGVQCFGKEAMEKNKELVEGKTIRMEKDVSETDRYKRLLRYVWKDDIFINEYLAREGYALQATFPPDVVYTKLFTEAAQEAREQNKGLWNACK